jgi:hypothetical protein|tara:strand:- start:306 stop:617 length:312 start_codon:yes stop_codon:yes gene_type:complete
MTYPASMICPYDEWFSEPIMTETQMEYMKLYSVQKEGDDIIVNMDGGVGGSWSVSKEPENIHQLMYDIATESAPITLQLNPPLSIGGGSETFQEGWQSGVGLL